METSSAGDSCKGSRGPRAGGGCSFFHLLSLSRVRPTPRRSVSKSQSRKHGAPDNAAADRTQASECRRQRAPASCQ